MLSLNEFREWLKDEENTLNESLSKITGGEPTGTYEISFNCEGEATDSAIVDDNINTPPHGPTTDGCKQT